jgi:tRNA threonylcarbamoyladenosine biosynthesis protein TsaB
VRILALDTATTATVAALLDTESGLALEARDDPPAGARPSHASKLLTLVDDVITRSGDGWAPINRIAIGVGPGTFTGLRIGIATAQGLARSRSLPLIGISTLHALALGAARALPEASAHERVTIVPAIDARRGEVFLAAWSANDASLAQAQVIPAAVLGPGALGGVMAGLTDAGAPLLAVGDGALKFRESFEAAGASVPPDEDPVHRVSAIALASLGAIAEPAAEPGAVQPDYLRVPDAELSRRP